MTLFNATPSTLDPTASTTLTATDVPTGKSGSTNPFNVNGTNNETKLRIIPELTTQTAGQTNDLTIVIGDEYGNPTDYTGNYSLIFSGANRAPGRSRPRPTVTPQGSAVGTSFGTNTIITFANGVARSMPGAKRRDAPVCSRDREHHGAAEHRHQPTRATRSP